MKPQKLLLQKQNIIEIIEDNNKVHLDSLAVI